MEVVNLRDGGQKAGTSQVKCVCVYVEYDVMCHMDRLNTHGYEMVPYGSDEMSSSQVVDYRIMVSKICGQSKSLFPNLSMDDSVIQKT